MEKQLTTLSGTVETVVYSNEDSGFTVLELNNGSELITVVGELMGAVEGEKLLLHGAYTVHPNYGTQFKASACERTLPATAAAIEQFLANGAIKGIGPVLANRLVKAFGDETLEVMEKEPQRLLQIPGISPAKCDKIAEEVSRLFGVRMVMLFLSRFGIHAATAIEVWKRYGTGTEELVRENPYVLCDESIGVDFELCDSMAERLDIPMDSSYRLSAGILHVLRHNLNNGHTCLPYDKLLPTACQLLEQSEAMVAAEIQAMIDGRQLELLDVNGRPYLYLPEYLSAEQYVASRILTSLQLHCPQEQDHSKRIAALEEKNGIRYAELQKKAIEAALNYPLLVLTGGPGTGKTTTINAIIELLEELELDVALAAPTGRAAKRMSEVTGRDAKTIHRLLEVDFTKKEALTFKRNERNPLPQDVIIVDEMSMVDIPLMRSLLAAVRLNARLILVGDSDQLPSVGPGNVLRDLIQSEKVKTVALTEIFRQAQQSMIVTNAHAIVRGEMPVLDKRDKDFFFMRREQYEQMKQTVVDLCCRRLPKSYGYDPIEDIQVIAPTRVGAVGTTVLNEALQKELNPPSPEKDEVKINGRTFRCGDKVMQIKNNYDILWTKDNGEEGMGVYNGDIGRIKMIDKPSKTLLIQFDEREAAYLFEMADQIELAYAVTVHKSQGSEFPAVILPIMGYKSKMHYRNLLYTAVTRAKNQLILLGVEPSVAYMVENDRRTIRYTNLLEMLKEECEL
ncbi:MAG: ATP-dependent RecD-like DNA helicase [Oscillospiraceae bacterium]|nr:ATP-dependent RecD-like DNA helicase [Oscillospiraceae bacterium]